MPISGTKTSQMERVVVDPPVDRTSLFLWRRDLELLRAIYRGTAGGYTVHIRAAVNAMCNNLRRELAQKPGGPELLRKLGQDQLQ